MRLSFAALPTLAALGATPLHGQEPAASRARTDTLLDALVGRWTMTGAVRGRPVRYVLEARRVLQGKYVELHMTDAAAAPPAYEARVIVGEGAKPGEYIAHWIDSFGAQYSVPPATGTQRGDTLFLAFPYPDGAFHDTFAYDRARRTWHFRLDEADGHGGWKLFAEYEVRPAEGAAATRRRRPRRPAAEARRNVQ
jgi:hypothetical protein